MRGRGAGWGEWGDDKQWGRSVGPSLACSPCWNDLFVEMCNCELREPIDNRRAWALINAIVSVVAPSHTSTALRRVAVILCSLLLAMLMFEKKCS